MNQWFLFLQNIYLICILISEVWGCLKYEGVYFMRGGMTKVNKNIILFVVPVARVLANGNRTIETVTKRYLSQK